MNRQIRAVLLALFACAVARSQTADQSLTFDVASIKAAQPRKPGEPQGRFGCFGGPGTRDPIRFACSRASVSMIATYAYDLKPYLLRPAISKDTGEFDVEARVPHGTTQEQIKVMLRNLLSERFKLTFHREKAEVPGYALVIAKSGLKMKDSMPDSPAAVRRPVTGATKDQDGFVYVPPRNSLSVGWANGLTRWAGNNVPMDSDARGVRLTGLLYSLVGLPVIDATGLTGKYDFTLTFSADSGIAASSDAGGVPASGEAGATLGLTIFGAVEEQLGLKMEPRKIPVELFVIDHAEKIPVEN
jgi:uncharacterized protein (TIGR03435 family)